MIIVLLPTFVSDFDRDLFLFEVRLSLLLLGGQLVSFGHLRTCNLANRGIVLNRQSLVHLVSLKRFCHCFFLITKLQGGAKILVRSLGHSHVFGLQDYITRLRARDDIHHHCSEFLRALKPLILICLLIISKSVQYLLLQYFLLKLARICLPG